MTKAYARPTGSWRIVYALLALLPLAAVLSGCSNNPYPRGESGRAVIYSTLGDEPQSLDPSVCYDSGPIGILALICPSFLHYQYLKHDPLVLEPDLGASMPVREPYVYTVNARGRTVRREGESWTFHIRHGVRYQDDPCFPGGKGREVLASDFVYSLRRMADPSVPCPIESYVEDKIVGFAEYAEANRGRAASGRPADYTSPVAGLVLLSGDPYTFRILLNQPYPQLRYLMAMPFTTPIPHEAVTYYGKRFARHPVGCGFYVMDEYTPKQRITLRINPNRPARAFPSEGMPGDRQAGLLVDAGKPLPFAERIVFTMVSEGITGWNLFEQGYLDAWGVTPENYNKVMTRQGTLSPEMKARGVQLVRSTPPSVSYLAFNMEDPLVGGLGLRQRRLRQAISLAIDRQALIDLRAQGFGMQAQSVIPPGIFGYEPGYRCPYGTYDLPRAKRLLAEAGYPGGIDPKTGERLSIYWDNSATDAAGRQFVGLVTKQFDALGVRLISRTWRRPVWEERIREGHYQFMDWGWNADYPDAENFTFMLYGPNKSPGPNYGRYRDPAYDRLFRQMRAMPDGSARLVLIRKMRDIAAEDCPWVYFAHFDSLSLFYDWLGNVNQNPIALDVLAYWRVDGALRARRQAEWNKPIYWPGAALLVFLVAGTLPAVRTVQKRRGRRLRRAEA